MARIQYSTPEGASGEIDLTSESMSVGRTDDNAIVIQDPSISSRHGEFTFDGSQWTFTDLGSTNGTKVHGQATSQFVLANGTSFTLGSVECLFIGDAPADDEDAYADHVSASYTATDGYGALPYNGGLRTGFGPKTRVADSGSGALIGLGVVGILACVIAAFLVSGMGS